MTVQANPKKMRPYDAPPKRRRRLIPDAPDSAAAGFFVVAALWLAVATGIGALAIGLRLVDFGFSFPLGVFDLSFTVDERRVDAAFMAATVYGWLSNAGFAAIAFMTPRLLGRPLAMGPAFFGGLAIWNMSLAGGLAALYVFDLGPSAPLAALPWLMDGGLATGALLVTAGFFATVAPALRSAYISIWFAGVALLGLMGLVGLNALVGLLDWFIGLDELLVALASAFVDRGLIVLWLLGMAYATLHYVVPRAATQPLHSAGTALLTFLTWLALAPIAAVAVLVDPVIPFFVTSAGVVATILLLVPASLALVNLAQSMRGRWTLVFGAGAAAFAVVGLAFLFSATLLESIGALRAVDAFLGRTDWVTGVFLWASYGTFTFAAFAMAEHAVPRIMRRAWGGGFLSGAQLWLAFGGVTIAGLALMGGGLAEGSLLAQGTPPDQLAAELLPYRAVALGGIGMLALAGVALVINLFLMYTSARPANYAVPGATTATAAGH
ncbi:MAG: cbb3-type cytochrome c oxidase subunit I [Chloroflexi bacterium]|nr:cbb3-type cytochrome c oxidase subunit I [Chloroflexota bacterium]